MKNITIALYYNGYHEDDIVFDVIYITMKDDVVESAWYAQDLFG